MRVPVAEGSFTHRWGGVALALVTLALGACGDDETTSRGLYEVCWTDNSGPIAVRRCVLQLTPDCPTGPDISDCQVTPR